jgi:hypothetical protein
MPTRNGKRKLVQPGEPSQRTKQGLEIPVPTADQVEDALRKAATRQGPGKRAKPSRSG